MCSTAGTWPAASVCAATKPEICVADGRDENCDGRVDENCGPARACGTSCCGATPPNTTAGCAGTSCTSACTTPLSCSTSDGHFCGSWDFSSNDAQFEGWRADQNGFGSMIKPTFSYSGGRLAATSSSQGGETLFLTTTLCGGSGTANVSGKTLHAELTVVPPLGSGRMPVYPNLLSSAGLYQVASDTDLLSSLTWDVPKLNNFDASTLEFQIAVLAPFSGTIFLDNVSIK